MELTRSIVTLHDPSAEGIGAMLLHLGLSKAVVEIHGGGGEPDRWWRDVTISECTGIIAAPAPDPAPVVVDVPATEPEPAPEPEPEPAPIPKPEPKVEVLPELTWMQNEIALALESINPRTASAMQVYAALPGSVKSTMNTSDVSRELVALAQAGQIRRVSTGRYQAN